MSDLDSLSPQERAQKLLSLLGSQPESEPEESVTFDPSLIPSVAVPQYERSEVDLEMDNVLDGIDIIEAYRKWCGKMEPKAGNRQESIMISCPTPGHRDSNPSAWMNSEKGTWYCGACQTGGDKYDIAAYHFGYNVPGYKTGEDFRKLRQQMAESYGFKIVKGHNGKEYPYVEPALPFTPPEPPPIPVAAPPVLSVVPPVTEIPPAEDSSVPIQTYRQTLGENADKLTIDWETLLTPGTFLSDWMIACTIDDLPHEYYFWLGLQALGFAGRTDVVLDDFKTVKPNLNICLYGPTGVGKSRSLDPYLRMLREALPFEDTDPYSDPRGVAILPVPGSSEALIDSLHHEVMNPLNQFDHLAEISGLLKFEEFASFVAKASKAGSSLKEIMIELYDVNRSDIHIHSRGSGLITARNPFVQVITTTQPNAIHAFLRRTDSESGFLNRWVFAAGIPRVEPIAYGLKRINIDHCAERLRLIRNHCKTGITFTLEGNALAVWESFFRQHIAPQRKGEQDTDSIFSRVELLIKKLIVLFTINEELSQPTEETVLQAISLHDYLLTSLGLINGDIAHTDSVACQDTILEVIYSYEEKYAKSPSRRDILRGIKSRFDMEVVDRTMKTLLSMEAIIETKPEPGHKGRPTTRYTCGN